MSRKPAPTAHCPKCDALSDTVAQMVALAVQARHPSVEVGSWKAAMDRLIHLGRGAIKHHNHTPCKVPRTGGAAKVLSVLILAGAACAVDAGVDALLMGASHHSDRSYPWREFNPGVGISPFFQWENAEVFLSMGQYRNSTDGTSFFEMVGGRVLKDYGDWTVGAWGAYGMLTGYAGEALRPVAGVSVGWRWLYLDAASRPATSNDRDVPETSVICAWLRVRAWRF